MRPDISVQILVTDENRGARIDQYSDMLHNDGCTFIRVSETPASEGALLLIEGWRMRPPELPEPEFWVALGTAAT